MKHFVLAALLLPSLALADVFLQSRSGRVVRADAPVPGFPQPRVSMRDFAGIAAERFTVIPVSGGNVRLCQGALCLTVEGNATDSAAPVALASYTGVDGQQWAFEPSSVSGYFRLRNKLGTYLDAVWSGTRAGLPLWTWSSVESDSQLFRTLEPFTLTPSSVPAHCPTGPVDVDRSGGLVSVDFHGSPWVHLELELRPTADRRTLEAETVFDAWGTDILAALHVTGRWVDTVATMPGTRTIGAFPVNMESEVRFRAPAAGFEFGLCADGEILTRVPASGPVRLFELIGDTGNDDGSNDWNCGCDAQFRRADFHPITVGLE